MNKRLLSLSGIAILAVIMNHASLSGFIALFWWTDRYLPVSVPNYDQMGSLSYYGLVAAQKLAIFSVPAFLFITGMFLSYAAGGDKVKVSWEMIQKRVLNLIPPYLIWSVVYFIVEFIIGNRYSPVEYVLQIVMIRRSVFFYIPLIILYYLISPFLVPLAKKQPKVLLGIGAIVLLLGISMGYIRLYARMNGLENDILTSTVSYLPEHQVLEYFFYYILGIVAGFHKVELKKFIFSQRWILLGLTIIAGLAAVIEAEWVFQRWEMMWRSRTLTIPSALYSISFILTYLAFEKDSTPRLLIQLGTNTLGIYLIHQTVLLVMPKVVYHIAPFLLGIQILYQPFLIATAAAIPMELMIITRTLPIRKYYRFLFG